jgi:hypothetical protein
MLYGQIFCKRKLDPAPLQICFVAKPNNGIKDEPNKTIKDELTSPILLQERFNVRRVLFATKT